MHKMEKAYFFDWMNTLGYGEDKGVSLTPRENKALSTGKFYKAHISKEYKDKLHYKLSHSRHALYPDSYDMIKGLKEAGYKLAIVSNIYDVTTKRIRKEFKDFLKFFDVITFSAEVGMMKPNSEIFAHTLNKLNKKYKENILPEEIVMIGDSFKNDIEPARNLGMKAKHINRNQEKLEDII